MNSDMKGFDDWKRVLKWPADSENRGIGCSAEALSQSNWIQVSFRKDPDRFGSISTLLEAVTRVSARSNAKVLFGRILSMRKHLAPAPALRSLGSFRADYSFIALLTRGSIFIDQLYGADYEHNLEKKAKPMAEKEEPKFVKVVREAMNECRLAAEETLEEILKAFDAHRNIDVLSAFTCLYTGRKERLQLLLNGDKSDEFAKPLPEHYVAIRKVVVTPSRVLLMCPEVVMTNRVVQKFGSESALKCIIRDEDLRELSVLEFSNKNIDMFWNSVTEKVRNTLHRGFNILNRRYQLLGWSQSQILDKSCYFHSTRKDRCSGAVSGTIDEIHAWMGNFLKVESYDTIRTRMGQCLAPAMPTVLLKFEDWRVEKDITSGTRNQFCCGRISYHLAKDISSALKLTGVPSCFRVQFKSFEGILVHNTKLDKGENRPKVIFRRHQLKFDWVDYREDDYLEVVNYSMPSPAYLNRNFINILDQVSKCKSSSLNMRIVARIQYYLDRELCLLRNMLIDTSQASEELTKRTTLPINWIQASKEAGFQLTADPFVRGIIDSIYRYNITEKLLKGQIILPPDLGRTMYGVIDETGLLQDGQVAVYYSPNIGQMSSKPVQRTGKVLVTKKSCIVPGDVRVYDAVCLPVLSHLIDVIVFPQHGPQSHLMDISRSSLDGDEYLVIWDEELILEYYEEATLYPSSENTTEERQILTAGEMVDVFMANLQSSSVDSMASAHLAMSDSYGLFDGTSESIARKCAIAKEFANSGLPTSPLCIYERPSTMPDFMASNENNVYYSQRLNGRLYRQVLKIQEILEENNLREHAHAWEYDRRLCPDDVDVFFGDKRNMLAATSVRDDYVKQVQRLLDEYGIDDESSLLSGHSVKMKDLDDSLLFNTQRTITLRYEKVFRAFRNTFFEEFGGEQAHMEADSKGVPTLRVSTAMRMKVRQWYYISYVEPSKSGNGKVLGQSLPWVAWDVLCSLRQSLVLLKQDDARLQVEHPLAIRLEQKIIESIEKKSEKFTEFQKTMTTQPEFAFVRQYSNVNGQNLVQVLFVIQRWLELETLLPARHLQFWQIARLFVRFLLGIFQQRTIGDYEQQTLGEPKRWISWLKKKSDCETDDKPSPTSFNLGAALIEFIRRLATQSFAREGSSNLQVLLGEEIEFYTAQQFLSLHECAYHALHRVALSGRFDAFALSSESSDVLVSESEEPLIVERSVFSLDYSLYKQIIPPQQVLEELQNWTGVQKILIRQLPHHPFEHRVMAVTAIGTATARRRLERILMWDENQIHRTIVKKNVPCKLTYGSI